MEVARTCVLATVLAILGWACGCAAASAEPKPILFLWESSGWGSPSGPNPYGLRFVAYDDGRVIYSLDTIEMSQEKPPRFKIVTLGPGEVASMARSILVKFNGLPSELRGAEPMTDMGSTTIQIVNPVSGRAKRYNAYGHPCRAPSRVFERKLDPLGVLQRESMDRRFLTACDDLSLFHSDAAQEWFPKTMWISLLKKSTVPEVQFDWPTDWPTMPETTEAPNDHRIICIRLAARQSDITRRLRSGSDLFNAGARTADGSDWWITNSWGYSLPGEIALTGTASNYPPLARGPCDWK